MKNVTLHYNVKWLRPFWWIGAITLGHNIYFRWKKEDVGEWRIKHELKHVEQVERVGLVKFYLTYVWYLLRYGYKDNPYEVEAVEAEK